MSGAKIVFAPQLTEVIFEAVPFGEENAVSVKSVMKQLEGKDKAHVQRCFHRLARKYRVISFKWHKTPYGQELLYWRDPVTAPACQG